MYKVSYNSYPTDASFVITDGWGTKYEYLIEGVGWKILEKLKSTSAREEYGWDCRIMQNRLNHLVKLTQICPERFDCKIDYATRI